MSILWYLLSFCLKDIEKTIENCIINDMIKLDEFEAYF